MNQQEILDKIEQISYKLEIRRSLVLSFLTLISSKEKYTSKDLVRKTGLSQTHLYRLIHEFTDILESKTKYISLKKEFSQDIQNALLISIENPDKKSIKNLLKTYQKLRPLADRQLDQFNATLNTTVNRAIKMSKNGDIYGKNIAFLGDDDLTSIATIMAGKPSKITVFEIDDRLNEFIQKIAKDNNFSIEVVKQDLRQPINKTYLEKYDIVFTDPPYTNDGINLFLNQAIKLIKNSFTSRIYLCYGNSDRAREREVEIQKILLDHQLLIKNKINNFNKYFGAESIGSSSSLYLLDWTPQTKTINSDFKKIYTHE